MKAMMKYLKYLLVGVLFGMALYKAEVISWFRIYEMFNFQSFHMYGIIGTAVVLGVLIVFLIKRIGIKDMYGQPIVFTDKNWSVPRYLLGGISFGMGWALLGSCPGPMFILAGSGATVFLVSILFAALGTFVYGLLRTRLPH
jgi:uncharacterized membrane protein YedE/YeeE